MSSERMRRVNEAIRQVLADALAGQIKDPRVGFVTVTDVKTSPDLRHARVFFSVLGDEERRAETLAGLRNAHGYLQGLIAAQLHIKRTPELDFFHDDTAVRAQRIERLLADRPPS